MQFGVILRWRKPSSFVKSLKACPLKGGPLSDFRTGGIPTNEKMRSSFGMTDFPAVDRTISIPGKREHSSITSTYSTFGYGPLKSIETLSQGRWG